jgi:hypothetical protein
VADAVVAAAVAHSFYFFFVTDVNGPLKRIFSITPRSTPMMNVRKKTNDPVFFFTA